MESNRIVTTNCDVCNAKGPALLCHDSNDVPVLGMCKVCDPQKFEEQARKDIDAWLAGGSEKVFGR